MKRTITTLLALVITLSLLAGCGFAPALPQSTEQTPAAETVSLEEIPAFSGEPYIEINGNIPFFTEEDLDTETFEYYSTLDSLGRCGKCESLVGPETMPTEERGAIGQVKPSGWQTVKYDFVDGKYLYNRCHLLGYQLTGENANECNLITGTRYMNVQGMLPYEDIVADYVKETGEHVLYRVTPIFEGDNLVASGVLMEAESQEDSGESVAFCVYVYNVQPGVSIDYATGLSELDETAFVGEEQTYILNISSRKFHDPSCSGAQTMKEENRQEYTGTREMLIAQGYEPCGTCKP